MTVFTSLHGRRLGLGPANGLISNDVKVTVPCVDASITVGAEATNVRNIAIQLKDANGADINYVQSVFLAVYADTGGAAFATTGGSTGIAGGTDGATLAVVAKKLFLCTSEADGDIDLTWTDTGTESVALAVIFPSGHQVYSEVFANS